MGTAVDFLQSFVPQLESYPVWVRWCVVIWIMLSGALIGVFVVTPRLRVPQTVLHANGRLAGSMEQLGLRSPKNDVPGEVRFINRLDQRVDVYWIDDEGHAQLFATLQNRDSYRVDSYEHHMWVLANQDKHPLATYETRGGKQTVVIEQ